MTRYAVRHATVYEYGGDVSHSHHLLHLKPREFAFQRCFGHSLALDPQPARRARIMDAPSRNAIARLRPRPRARPRLAVAAEMHVEIFPRGAQSLETAEPWDEAPQSRATTPLRWLPPDLGSVPVPHGVDHVPLKQAFGTRPAIVFAPGRRSQWPANALMRKIHREFKYVSGSTTNRTSIVDVFKNRRGVCQDFAHFAIRCVRSSGLAAAVSAALSNRSQRRQSRNRGDASHAGYPCIVLRWVGWTSVRQQLHGRRRPRNPRVGPRLRQASRRCAGVIVGAPAQLKVDVRDTAAGLTARLLRRTAPCRTALTGLPSCPWAAKISPGSAWGLADKDFPWATREIVLESIQPGNFIASASYACMTEKYSSDFWRLSRATRAGAQLRAPVDRGLRPNGIGYRQNRNAQKNCPCLIRSTKEHRILSSR